MENRFEKMINLLENYFVHYGNCNIPKDFKSKDGINYDEEGYQLGQFVVRLPSLKDSLTEELKDRLEFLSPSVQSNEGISLQEFVEKEINKNKEGISLREFVEKEKKKLKKDFINKKPD